MANPYTSKVNQAVKQQIHYREEAKKPTNSSAHKEYLLQREAQYREQASMNRTLAKDWERKHSK